MLINYTKRKHIKSVAKMYLYLNNLKNFAIRFDVIEVFIINGKCNINHIEGIV